VLREATADGTELLSGVVKFTVKVLGLTLTGLRNVEALGIAPAGDGLSGGLLDCSPACTDEFRTQVLRNVL
jgi:hypothetical protein